MTHDNSGLSEMFEADTLLWNVTGYLFLNALSSKELARKEAG